jgi:hypothetical protein
MNGLPHPRPNVEPVARDTALAERIGDLALLFGANVPGIDG